MKWINVSKKLPKKAEPVMACVVNQEDHEVYVTGATYDPINKKWTSEYGKELNNKQVTVKYWMPTPKTRKEWGDCQTDTIPLTKAEEELEELGYKRDDVDEYNVTSNQDPYLLEFFRIEKLRRRKGQPKEEVLYMSDGNHSISVDFKTFKGIYDWLVEKGKIKEGGKKNDKRRKNQSKD